MTKEFLDKRGFRGKQLEKVISTLKKITLPSNGQDYSFSPYVIDVIADFNGINDDTSILNSKLLNTNKPQDYTIACICNREITRQGQVGIDKQIKVLMDLAVEHNGAIKKNKLFIDILSKYDVSEDKTETFSVHPLLYEENKVIYLKHDHFEEYFKNIYLAYFINVKSSKPLGSRKIINILIENCSFKSSSVKEISSRIEGDVNLGLSNIKEFIQNTIIYLMEAESDSELICKSVSGLLMIALEFNSSDNSIQKNTETLKSIFDLSTNNETNDFYIYNLNAKVKFDFSDIIFKNTTINGYKYFFDCQFNEKTYFDSSCKLLELGYENINNISATEKNFNIKLQEDGTLSNIIRNKNQNIQNKQNEALTMLKSFFSMFNYNGYYIAKEEKSSRSKFNKSRINQKIEFDDLIYILKKENVLNLVQRENVYIEIVNDYKGDVDKLCNNGFPSLRFKNLIKEITEELL